MLVPPATTLTFVFWHIVYNGIVFAGEETQSSVIQYRELTVYSSLPDGYRCRATDWWRLDAIRELAMV